MGMAGMVILRRVHRDGDLRASCLPTAGLDVTQVDGPILAPPSWEYPLGTDDLGRSVLTLVDLGFADLVVGRACWRRSSR